MKKIQESKSRTIKKGHRYSTGVAEKPAGYTFMNILSSYVKKSIQTVSNKLHRHHFTSASLFCYFFFGENQYLFLELFLYKSFGFSLSKNLFKLKKKKYFKISLFQILLLKRVEKVDKTQPLIQINNTLFTFQFVKIFKQKLYLAHQIYFLFHRICGNIIQAKNKSITSPLFSIHSFHLSTLECPLECVNWRGTNVSLFKF